MGLGGGAYNTDLVNCEVLENIAEDSGGGVFGGSVTHCTIVANRALNYTAGGIHSCTAVNSIVYGNLLFSGWLSTNYDESSTFERCCVTPLPLPNTGNNIEEDPQVMDTGSSFWVNSGSPCIDAVTNSAVLTDYHGTGRPLDGNRDQIVLWDIGATEKYLSGTDSDGDRMSDEWEITYGLNPAQDDAQADPDADGQNNFCESVAGTDPFDTDSCLCILRCEDSSQRTVFFTPINDSVEQHYFDLQFKTNLVDSGESYWETVSGCAWIQSSAGHFDVPAEHLALPAVFYRITAHPQY